jgi:ABC-type Mn2+/Zn2+ transport system ATPase subunit
MEWCGVADLRHRAVNTLSGGERQRVVIARSLLGGK